MSGAFSIIIVVAFLLPAAVGIQPEHRPSYTRRSALVPQYGHGFSGVYQTLPATSAALRGDKPPF
jgi:hypothetical protein